MTLAGPEPYKREVNYTCIDYLEVDELALMQKIDCFSLKSPYVILFRCLANPHHLCSLTGLHSVSDETQHVDEAGAIRHWSTLAELWGDDTANHGEKRRHGEGDEQISPKHRGVNKPKQQAVVTCGDPVTMWLMALKQTRTRRATTDGSEQQLTRVWSCAQVQVTSKRKPRWKLWGELDREDESASRLQVRFVCSCHPAGKKGRIETYL